MFWLTYHSNEGTHSSRLKNTCVMFHNYWFDFSYVKEQRVTAILSTKPRPSVVRLPISLKIRYQDVSVMVDNSVRCWTDFQCRVIT